LEVVSDKKPVYLIAGRQAARKGPDPVLLKIYRESGKTSPVIAYSGTANGDDERFFTRMAEAFREAGAGKIEHVRLSSKKADIEKAKDTLTRADIIFISGGDVEVGMEGLKENNMAGFLTSLYEQGKPFFGTSAGAIMLAKEWVRWPDPDDDSSAELFPCLGFAPIICDCHDEESGWEELRGALKLKEDGIKGYGLSAGSTVKVFADGKVEVVAGTVNQYVRRGKKIEKLSDITSGL
jgi:peptidase E